MDLWTQFTTSWSNYASWTLHDLTHPGLRSFTYWLVIVSLAVYLLELARPWRRHQARFRRGFWLDAFYMLFNVILFSLVGYFALSEVVVHLFRDALASVGVSNLVAVEVGSWPVWAQLLSLFLLRDFVQWNVHRLLHRVDFLWQFHKVHHSVLEMGFAAHLRFHPMETVVYRTLEYLPLALVGYGIDDFLAVHVFALTIGHVNHANLVVPLGPLRYVLNNPQMHIWHHVRDLPPGRRWGVNYGISLSVWDYLFGTACVPSSGRDIALGFPDVEDYPPGFLGQLAEPFRRRQAPRTAPGGASEAVR